MTTTRTGLGIDFCPPQTSIICRCSAAESYSNISANDPQETFASRGNIPAMKSISAMRGLVLAEVGDSMVELDICGGGSGFREGQRIALASLTPGGGSRGRPIIPVDETSLTRQGTLLTVGAAPGRNAAELKSLLGNSSAKLKSGAAVLPPPGQKATDIECVALEQAKPKAQVEVDIVLESNTCVQGSYLKGHVKILVRKRSGKESAVFLAEGKVRVVGFECIPNEDDRHTFYHHAAPLSTITDSLEKVYVSLPDSDGYAEAREGVHVLPFAMLLPLENESGNATGVLQAHSGVTLRYIALISIKVRDRVTDKLSIAHFYRNCEIWPRLNPSVVLAPTSRPIQATAAKTLFMGGSGKVTLTATLHRLHWIAGQKCFVKVSVVNYTKKTIKSLTLSLVRTTVCFKPHPDLDALPSSREHAADPDACQTSTTQKQVSESTLEMGQRGTKGHASAKGWWTGVSPGEDMTFSHFILLPPDALSVPRVRLLEVSYTIQVSLNAGSLASDVHVNLPIKIINFVSLDPPPSSPLSVPEASVIYNSIYKNTVELTEAFNGVKSHHRARPVISGIFSSDEDSRILDPLLESDENPMPMDQEVDFSPRDCSSDDDCYASEDQDASSIFQSSDYVGNLSLRDDSDDVVNYAITSARKDEYGDNRARFSDLYYSSIQEALYRSGNLSDVPEAGSLTDMVKEYEEVNVDDTPRPPTQGDPPRTSYSTIIASDATPVAYLDTHTRPRGLSTFALRVQEKLQAACSEMGTAPGPLPRLDIVSSSFSGSSPDSGRFDELVDESTTTLADIKPGLKSCLKSVSDSTLGSLSCSQPGSPRSFVASDPGPTSCVSESAGLPGLSASSVTNTTVARTSRLLPTPPSTIVFGPSATIPASPKELPQTSTFLRLRVEPSPVRANLQQPSGGPAGCSSVKDKIREFEERAKIERAKEADRDNGGAL